MATDDSKSWSSSGIHQSWKSYLVCGRGVRDTNAADRILGREVQQSLQVGRLSRPCPLAPRALVATATSCSKPCVRVSVGILRLGLWLATLLRWFDSSCRLLLCPLLLDREVLGQSTTAIDKGAQTLRSSDKKSADLPAKVEQAREHVALAEQNRHIKREGAHGGPSRAPHGEASALPGFPVGCLVDTASANSLDATAHAGRTKPSGDDVQMGEDQPGDGGLIPDADQETRDLFSWHQELQRLLEQVRGELGEPPKKLRQRLRQICRRRLPEQRTTQPNSNRLREFVIRPPRQIRQIPRFQHHFIGVFQE